MASSQSILDDINLRYRNTFTTSQILVWMNEEQQELFETLELDAPPINFPLQTDVQFYAIPVGIDIDKIKTVTIQINDDPTLPDFSELPFKRNDDRQYTNGTELYYTIVGDSFFIPIGALDDRQVYVYMDSNPAEITLNLTVSPDLPTKFQELLKLGTLKRIAGARKDTQMYNNYSADYEQKIADILWNRKLSEPEFTAPIDMNYKPIGCTGWTFDRYIPTGL
jgi:hypothetical protein